MSSYPSTTSKISNPLNILLLQTRQNCLGRSWNPSTKRPERQLHSWASMCATQHVWTLSQHQTISHLYFLSEACLYPDSSLMMSEWGLLQSKMARKTLIKRWFFRFVLVHSLEQTTTVTCITWQYSLSQQFLKTADVSILSPFMEKLSGSDYLFPKSHWKK